MGRLFGLFLLLWMDLGVNGQETMDIFIHDLVVTFKLASPTIIYDSDEGVPEICYTSQWILCLSSKQHESDQNEMINETYGKKYYILVSYRVSRGLLQFWHLFFLGFGGKISVSRVNRRLGGRAQKQSQAQIFLLNFIAFLIQNDIFLYIKWGYFLKYIYIYIKQVILYHKMK